MLVETIPVDSFPVSTEIVLNMLRVKTNQYGCEWISINVPGTHTKYDFDTYIWTLPMWKQQLLMHWVPFLSTTDQILFASDGSFDQEEKKGSFGAVFGDNDQLYATISQAQHLAVQSYTAHSGLRCTGYWQVVLYSMRSQHFMTLMDMTRTFG